MTHDVGDQVWVVEASYKSDKGCWQKPYLTKKDATAAFKNLDNGMKHKAVKVEITQVRALPGGVVLYEWKRVDE